MTDGEGNVHSRQLFLPYGDTRWQEGALPTDFGFGGQRHDGSTGLVFMHARYYHAGLGRFVSADTIVPGVDSEALNRYMYANGNPLRYVDPSGHVTVDPERAQQLHDYGLSLLNQDVTPMERFEEFMRFAATLYGDDETDQFMVDVTAVFHGHEYDTEGGYRFYTQRRDFSSKYFVGFGAFHTEWDKQHNKCGGWSETYKDDSDNQTYHFWFYVATSYFDGEAAAYGGNVLHDGYSTPIGAFIGPHWNRIAERIGIPEQFRMDIGNPADPATGISRPDYDLGVRGVNLGRKLWLWNDSQVGKRYFWGGAQASPEIGTSPQEVANWLQTNLAE